MAHSLNRLSRLTRLFHKLSPCSNQRSLSYQDEKIAGMIEDAAKPLAPKDPRLNSPFELYRKDGGLAGVDTIALLQRNKLNLELFKTLIFEKNERLVIQDQCYNEENRKEMGANICAAHFVINHGGAILINDHDHWINQEYLDKNPDLLPTKYKSNISIEAIDTTGMILYYEGFWSLVDLGALKTLILRGPKIDDWCLSKLHIFRESLENLHIDDCPLVTERGLCTLHTLRHLKFLKLGKLTGASNLELFTILFEDYMPQCKVLGVDLKEAEKRLLQGKETD